MSDYQHIATLLNACQAVRDDDSNSARDYVALHNATTAAISAILADMLGNHHQAFELLIEVMEEATEGEATAQHIEDIWKEWLP